MRENSALSMVAVYTAWADAGGTIARGQAEAYPGLEAIVTHLFWMFFREAIIRRMAAEIEQAAIEFLKADRAFRAAWPWETDVMIRMAIDQKAHRASA